MARPSTGRRIHAAAFDQILNIRGTTPAKVAGELKMSQGHLSDLRNGRRLATPPVWTQLAEYLSVEAEAILWPITAVDSTRTAA